ncbi:MAG: DNA topoisomerase III [Ruminococcus sp.]|nr:DNA topoisomerase III [Ruminococcus sp.]
MSILILAEKPLIGQEIAKVLPGSLQVSREEGVLRKGNYVIAWAYGHLLRLKAPESYHEKYKEWKLEELPIFFEEWELEVKPEAEKRVRQIGKLLKEAEQVIHAGDVDEEGQLLIDELLRWHRYSGTVKRLDTSSLTEGDLKRAFANLKGNQECEREGWAAYARSVADYVMGINMSRYFSIKNQLRLSVGRVQSPTLGLVVNRDLIIESHKKVLYYKVYADFKLDGQQVKAEFIPNKEEPSLEDGKMMMKSYAIQKQQMLQRLDALPVKVEKRSVKEAPPLPFNLVKLQSYCGKKWGYTPTDVMAITQALREKYKAITYNRSDCQYLSEEHYKEAPGVIAKVLKNLPEYVHHEISTDRKSRCFQDENVSAHHAIIPTAIYVDISQFTEKEKNVYQAICAYYLVQFLPEATKEKTILQVDLPQEEELKAAAVKTIKPGYRELLRIPGEQPNPLSLVRKGGYIEKIIQAEIKELETRPPARYTESSLNEDMTRIAKYVTDPEVKQILLDKDKDKKGENGSIGTSSTRGMIIDNLVKRGFLELNGKNLISTQLGRELYRILPDEAKKADVTARWWAVLEDVKKDGNYQMLIHQVLSAVKQILHTEYPLINKAISLQGRNTVRTAVGRCPKCGDMIMATSKGFFCEKRDCTFALWPKMKFFTNEIAITPEKAKALLGSKKRAAFTLKNKEGNSYQGYLKIKLNGDFVNFEFDGLVKRGKR